ncbi:hypothetical protein [Salmonirosea aquatica]
MKSLLRLGGTNLTDANAISAYGSAVIGWKFDFRKLRGVNG